MEYIFKPSKRKGLEDMGNVYARIRNGNEDHKLGMHFRITRNEWLKYRSGRYSDKALMTSIGISYSQFADILYEIKSRIEKGLGTAPTGNLIRAQVSLLIGGSTAERGTWQAEADGKKGRMPLTAYIERYMHDLISGKRLKTGTSKRVSDHYAHSFGGLMKDLKTFEKTRRKGRITLDDFNKKVHDELLAWYHHRGLLPNTIAGKFQRLHVVLSTAYKEKMTDNRYCCHSEFIPRGQIVDHIYLSDKQIQAMLNLDLSSPQKVRILVEKCTFDKERERKVHQLTSDTQIGKIELARDLFIIGCLTGQRISDYARISDDMLTQLDAMDFIRLRQVKTGKKVVIPMDARVAEILKKYNGCPPRISNERINDCLQLLGELLGWTWNAKLDPTRMGHKRGPRFCDMITTHTARRSFATNAFIAGVPLASIMAVTGHTTERMLRRYLKLYAEEQAVIAYNDLKGFLDLD